MEKAKIRQRKIDLGNGKNATISLVKTSYFYQYTVMRFADFEIFTVYDNPDVGDADFAEMDAKQALSFFNEAISKAPVLRYHKGNVGITMLLPLN